MSEMASLRPCCLLIEREREREREERDEMALFLNDDFRALNEGGVGWYSLTDVLTGESVRGWSP